ncbi:MAG: hypothetical protein OSA43_08670, partial [Pirellulales bacterium]|nr:hypothetical protein [Pirellulales bacterium]
QQPPTEMSWLQDSKSAILRNQSTCCTYELNPRTIALSIGFFAYTQSSLNNLISFGLITGLIIIIIIIALLADLLLAPAMMALIYRNSDSHSK